VSAAPAGGGSRSEGRPGRAIDRLGDDETSESNVGDEGEMRRGTTGARVRLPDASAGAMSCAVPSMRDELAAEVKGRSAGGPSSVAGWTADGRGLGRPSVGERRVREHQKVSADPGRLHLRRDTTHSTARTMADETGRRSMASTPRTPCDRWSLRQRAPGIGAPL
jgi:hypothetical protein